MVIMNKRYEKKKLPLVLLEDDMALQKALRVWL